MYKGCLNGCLVLFLGIGVFAIVYGAGDYKYNCNSVENQCTGYSEMVGNCGVLEYRPADCGSCTGCLRVFDSRFECLPAKCNDTELALGGILMIVLGGVCLLIAILFLTIRCCQGDCCVKSGENSQV